MVKRFIMAIFLFNKYNCYMPDSIFEHKFY